MPRLAVFPKGFFEAIVERRMSVFEWIQLAGTLDVDGVELHPLFLEAYDSRYLARVRAEADRRGLALPMLCHSPDFTQPDAEARRREVRRTREMFKVTAELGGGRCRVLSGQNHPGIQEREATQWVIESLWELERDAEAEGVVMCLENHYKDSLWHYPEFAQSSLRYLAILDAVDSPWLKAQYDPSNAIVAGEDQYALLDRVLPRVATVHASDRFLEGGTIKDLQELDRDPQTGYAAYVQHGVIGNGLNDYDRILSMLAEAGFTGWVSIEDGEGPTVAIGMDHLHRSVSFLRERIARNFTAPP